MKTLHLFVAALLVLNADGACAGPALLSKRAVLETETETLLSSPIAATITSLSVHPGDTVKKGQILVEFDCSVMKAEKREATAAVRAAAAKHSQLKELSKYDAATPTETHVASAELAQARAKRERISAELNHCKVISPFDGKVVSRYANPWQTVQQGQKLLHIIDDSELRVISHVPSTWLQWLRPGLKFAFAVEDNRDAYPAEIIKIGAKVDEASKTISVYGKLMKKSPTVLAGMSGIATFIKPTSSSSSQ